MSPERLPRDYRVALAVALGVAGFVLGAREWVVHIARAEAQGVRDDVAEMKPKVDALYYACVREGRCRPDGGWQDNGTGR